VKSPLLLLILETTLSLFPFTERMPPTPLLTGVEEKIATISMVVVNLKV